MCGLILLEKKDGSIHVQYRYCNLEYLTVAKAIASPIRQVAQNEVEHLGFGI